VVVGISSGFVSAIIGVLFFVIIFASVISSYNSDISTMKHEYNYYSQMIDRANNYSEYRTRGEVTALFEVDGKYYITYTIKEFGYPDDWGVSFPIYTLEEANLLVENGVDLALAKKYNVMTEYSDSVPMDHTKDKMSIDADYVTLIRLRTVFIWLEVIAVAGVGVVVFFAIRSYIRKKNGGDSGEDTKTASNTLNRCNHCGATYPLDVRKCTSCGSLDGSRIKHKGD
jgi:hypothetical protein